MKASDIMLSLGTMLASGSIEVVDCSGVLGPGTPILQLPPDFAKNTPKEEIHKISEYDNDGPFFAWNWLFLEWQLSVTPTVTTVLILSLFQKMVTFRLTLL